MQFSVDIMDVDKTFHSDFQQLSTFAWLEKVKNDLKGRPIKDLYKNYQGLLIDPFANFDENSVLPSVLKITGNQWWISENIHCDDPDTANNHILDALTNGVNTIFIHFDTDIDSTGLSTLFKNVEHEYIHCYFILENDDSIDTLKEYIKNQSKESFLVIIQTNGRAIDTKFKMISNQQNIEEESIASYLGDIIAQTHSHLSNAASIDSLLFRLQAHGNFLLNIAIVRSFKCLYSNLLTSMNFSVQSEPTIISHWSMNDENSNSNLIQNAAMSLSSILGGVTILDIPLAGREEEKKSFYHRMNRNLQHVMQMESNLGEQSDPVEGSYFFEDLTKQITENSWEAFLSILNKKS